ncbi:MAG: site-2 protease family protein [Erysipelotrichaceae bacterium]|nr:site-2 protease family protein [Erysipelotrichaceae bacterium]
MILAGLFGFAWDLVVFVVALSILILIHELGHFFFAKLFKVYCYEFSLGMGPVLVQRERKNDETKYSIRAFPIGGYVAMAGESTEEDNSVPFERTINGVASWKKMIIVIAGVMMNFILAFILFVGIFLSVGTPSNKYKLQVTNDGIAYEAGLRTGDTINNISSMIVENGEDDIYETSKVSSLLDVIDFLNDNTLSNKNQVQEIVFNVTRNESTFDIDLTRGYSKGKVQSIGITIVELNEKQGFFKTIGYAAKYEFEVTGMIFEGVAGLFTKEGWKNVGGPIQIFQITSEAASLGFINFLMLLAVLSANLGVINLLPIPALDGARFLTSLWEVITRKRVNAKAEAAINAVGMIFLLGLMGIIIVKDIVMLF